ncbi:MAG: hypothetical protein CSB44_12690 [Gammaproteobacteria bacterium]|nr:MAG: hypothetical protein CSB44_12690 [Gammaproteobacteria bacterium]
MTLTRTHQYITARAQNPAWRLLASRRAPIVIACLHSLFEDAHDGVLMDDALHALADMLAPHANDEQYDLDPARLPQLAGRELREWIRRALIIERGGRIYATDALQSAIAFVEGLDNRIMTSTASRLSVVQREIERLESGLNPDAGQRIASLERRIAELQRELAAAETGDVPVLDAAEAIERIREIYTLATGLRADFRRVEDSWREADKSLRQNIINEQQHRGNIVDQLLDGHEALLDTAEGRVFENFQAQLRQSTDLDFMRARLREILAHAVSERALTASQQNDLRFLVARLVKESEVVFQARARSERDVKGFLKTGLAAEHHRVGQLLSDIFQEMLQLDWQRAATRRTPAPLPPVAIPLTGLPLIERLRYKSLDEETAAELDLAAANTDAATLGEDFWTDFDGLDREALIAETLAVLKAEERPLSLAELAQALPPTPSHDLETFALWITMAREAGIDIVTNATETVDITDDDARQWRFTLPLTRLDAPSVESVEWEI